MIKEPFRTNRSDFWAPLWLNRTAYRDIAVTCIFLNLLALSLPVFTRVVYDRVIPNFAEATLWVLFSGMVLVLLFEALFKTSRAYLTDHLGHQAACKLEQELQQHLLHMPNGPDVARSGQIFMQLQEIRDFYCQKLVPTLIDAPFVFAFLLAIMLLSPPMAMVPLVIGIFLVGSQYAFHRILHKEMAAYQRAQLTRQQTLIETLAGRETIRQLAGYTPFIERWNHVTAEMGKRTASLATWHSIVNHICTGLIILNVVVLMAVGVYEINNGELSIGALLAVNLLSARALAPLASIGSILTRWPQVRAQMHAIELVLEQPAELDNPEAHFILKGDLALTQASVQYPRQPLPVLKDISLQLAHGKKLAIIGASGAGKSTLLRAITAEIPLQNGIIRWDERDLRHISPANLRAQIGLVDQYPFFFARSLRENLLMGLERDDEAMYRALEVVGLDGFVKTLGHGLDLPIAEGGANLSGGQRQCLAIARALLRDAPVMLMDEPTSMMDHVMEARAVNNLKEACKDKTLIVVTHRSPMLALVDQVALLDNGQITRHGPRDEILKELSKQIQAQQPVGSNGVR